MPFSQCVIKSLYLTAEPLSLQRPGILLSSRGHSVQSTCWPWMIVNRAFTAKPSMFHQFHLSAWLPSLDLSRRSPGSSSAAPPPPPSSNSSACLRILFHGKRSTIRSDVASGDFTSFLSAFQQSDCGASGPPSKTSPMRERWAD